MNATDVSPCMRVQQAVVRPGGDNRNTRVHRFERSRSDRDRDRASRSNRNGRERGGRRSNGGERSSNWDRAPLRSSSTKDAKKTQKRGRSRSRSRSPEAKRPLKKKARSGTPGTSPLITCNLRCIMH